MERLISDYDVALADDLKKGFVDNTTRTVSLCWPRWRSRAKIRSKGDRLPAQHRIAARLFFRFDDVPGI